MANIGDISRGPVLNLLVSFLIGASTGSVKSSKRAYSLLSWAPGNQDIIDFAIINQTIISIRRTKAIFKTSI